MFIATNIVLFFSQVKIINHIFGPGSLDLNKNIKGLTFFYLHSPRLVVFSLRLNFTNSKLVWYIFTSFHISKKSKHRNGMVCISDVLTVFSDTI